MSAITVRAGRVTGRVLSTTIDDMNTVTVVGQMTSARADFMCQADGFTTFGNVRYRSEHRGPIPLLLEHDEGRRIGRVIFIQRSKSSGLHAVAVLDSGVDLADDVTWSMSAGLHGRSRRQHGDSIFE